MLLGKNEYKLILLDTNALREIVTNENFSGKGFLSKFFAEQRLYAPCFSIYNAVELIPYLNAVITENYQANVYKKAKSFIPQMQSLEIYTLKDIREC